MNGIGYQKEGNPDGTSPVTESQESVFGGANVTVKYGPDHIYTRIARVWGGKGGRPNPYASMFGYTPQKVAVAAEEAHEKGICIQSYADPVACVATLKALGLLR